MTKASCQSQGHVLGGLGQTSKRDTHTGDPISSQHARLDVEIQGPAFIQSARSKCFIRAKRQQGTAPGYTAGETKEKQGTDRNR